MKKILKSRQNGFAIIEALIAFLLLGIGVAALIYLQGNLMSGSSLSKARAEAMELAKDRTEVLRNYIDKRQFLSVLRGVIQDDTVDGVNAKYIVCYAGIPTIPVTPTTVEVSALLKNPVSLEVTVKWSGAEGDAVTCSTEGTNDEKVTLETMLYFMSPAIVSAIDTGEGYGEDLPFPLLSPFITGVEGEHSSTKKFSSDEITDAIDNAKSEELGLNISGDIVTVDIRTYVATSGRSNVEVVHGGEVVLTSFGGIVHRIKGKIISDRFSVPLDSDGDGVLSQDELRNFWIDAGDEDGVIDVGEVKHWIDNGPECVNPTFAGDGKQQWCEYLSYWDDDGAGDGIAGDGIIQQDEFPLATDSNSDGTIDESEIGIYWWDNGDTRMQENEVKYWLDANSDGEIQQDEYTYWVDADHDDIVDVGEFDPPEATATASSAIEDLSVLGSPPSFCLFPICDDPFDTDNDCKVPVDPTMDDGTVEVPLNNDVDEYGIASYVCYVPGDCTYQDDYAGTDDSKLNGCPSGFIPPTDDAFDDLNGGWYGRIGNFGVKLNPDDMVCTADTTKTHLTPSREYVTYRGVCSDGTLTDETSCISGGGSWDIIANEGINTPYSNQTFIIARKNNKPSVYCPIRALSYEGNLVNEQIKRELNGIKEFVGGIPVVTDPDWDKNVVLPENVCTLGLSCSP